MFSGFGMVIMILEEIKPQKVEISTWMKVLNIFFEAHLFRGHRKLS